ncbi:MAG TPA: DMT family transporter [Stellaceae bacterium]|nr:DMT family transporter [Stellaceae bacterium]
MVSLSRAAQAPAFDGGERTLTGIAMALTAMFLFSGMDGLSKYLAVDYHPIEIAAMRQFFTTLALLPFLLRSPLALRTKRPLVQIGRGLCMFCSSILFIFGLSHLPIADASAIGFVSPLLVTALSIPLLGEKVGIRRWSAVIVGFTGVMIVVRPGTGAFDPAALYPLASAAAWALGLILTRIMRNSDQVLTTIFYSTLVGLVIGGAALPFVWRTPDLAGLGLMAAMGLLSTISQTLLISAFARAAASILAPFSYSQMVWSTLIGYFVFATLPDALTWIGAAIVIASGIYTLHREHVVHRERMTRRRLA